MKKKIKLLAACAALAAAGNALAQNAATPAPQNVLQLTASGTVEVQQDMLSMTLVTTRDATDAATVQTQLKAALDAALAEAKKNAQAGQLDVRTGNFSLSPRYTKDGKINGWQGSTELVLEGRDFPRITQTAGRISTLSVGNVGFGLSREQRAKTETEAQNIAIDNFKQKANELAKGFGDSAAPKAEVEALGVRAEYHGADMSKPGEIEDMMKFAASRFGRVDILVNNAGIQHVAKVEDFPTERWDAIIAIFLTSAFHTTRLAIPAMREANWGRVINIASAHGLVASAQKSAYVAAKHGVVGLTKAVALETATTGVTVNAICPGWVLTALVQKQIDDRAAREGITVAQAQNDLLGEKQPSLQFTTVEQLGGLAVFLCSPAADQVRGQAWAMDGGWTAQ